MAAKNDALAIAEALIEIVTLAKKIDVSDHGAECIHWRCDGRDCDCPLGELRALLEKWEAQDA